MKTTIFTFHPQLKTGSRINKELAEVATGAGYDVRDMYQLYPNFDIDVKTEQKILEDSDRIVLQFPIYWYQTPALMKQWFDAVFEYGWAYGSTGTALQGKEVMLVASFGASAADYQLDGRFQVTVEELLKPITTIQFLTGLSFSEPFIITASLNTSDKDITEQAQAFLARLSEK